MKRIINLLLLLSLVLGLQAANLRFALLTDIHISPTNPGPLEDLKRSIDEIRTNDSIDFVIVSGDLTEAGD